MEEYKPTIVLLACQFMYAGVTLSGRAALLQDMSSRVFVVYRQCTAFLLIAPIAFFTRREAKRCSLGWKNFWLISLLSFVGFMKHNLAISLIYMTELYSVTLNQNTYFEGLYLSSSSTASALFNLVPAITFIMAYTMGFEKVHLRSIRSVAKIIGTVFCVAGAVTMALVKGPKLLNMEFHHTSLLFNAKGHDTWLIGCLLLLASSSCWSLWLILQVHVSSQYPDHLSLTAWMCLFAALQSGFLTLLFEPNAQWRLKSYLQLMTCLYSGMISAITFFAQAWCISRRGPLFSAMFNPLCTVIVTVFACIFMNEEMYTGSLVGALAVMIGLYTVLWGKAKDHKEINEDTEPLKKPNDQAILYVDCDLEDPLLNKESANTEVHI